MSYIVRVRGARPPSALCGPPGRCTFNDVHGRVLVYFRLLL